MLALPGRQGPQRSHGGVQVAGGPQHGGVEHQAERTELIPPACPVRLHDLPARAVADVAGELVAGLLDGELPVHLPPVGVIHRAGPPQQVESPGDPPDLGERLPQRGGAVLAAGHCPRTT